MLTRFDHIVRNALGNLMTSNVPDWDIFHDILLTEEDMPDMEENGEVDLGNALHDLEYTGSLPAWIAFESQLDNLNRDMDAEFDQTIGEALEHIPEVSTSMAGWDLMSNRLDKLNAEMDAEFDQTVGDAMVNLPEATWKEQHWQMLSSRLDRLNDKPRQLMMKVIEAAAILLLLIQLTNLYSDFQQNNGQNNFLTAYLDRILNSNEKSDDGSDQELIIPPNSFPSEKADELTEKPVKTDKSIPDNEVQSKGNINTNELASGLPDQTAETGQRSNNADRSLNNFERTNVPVVAHLNSDRSIAIPYNYLRDAEARTHFLINKPENGIQITPQLANDPHLIAYEYDPNEYQGSSPRLGVRDIILLTTSSTDIVLSSIPTIQVIRPRLHSSIGFGVLTDATNVEIQNYFSLSGPYHEQTINPGAYFRYKIQYENMFGSLGADYLTMRYDGQSDDNELTMVSLPLELGYNVVNLPALRMYFSGGIAGRFVPTASYSPETFNQESPYSSKSNKQSFGLLNNGPFEINYYLSGRLSMGLDINVNKKTSINLRFSHDIWLKGRGIGYNHDKFRSSHLAIGTNFHL